ncbi:MAG: hypothetical protein QXK89_00955 [Candidatus Bathyarchaeia archaeon]
MIGFNKIRSGDEIFLAIIDETTFREGVIFSRHAMDKIVNELSRVRVTRDLVEDIVRRRKKSGRWI